VSTSEGLVDVTLTALVVVWDVDDTDGAELVGKVTTTLAGSNLAAVVSAVELMAAVVTITVALLSANVTVEDAVVE
jgi:hypothetical protein